MPSLTLFYQCYLTKTFAISYDPDQTALHYDLFMKDYFRKGLF